MKRNHFIQSEVTFKPIKLKTCGLHRWLGNSKDFNYVTNFNGISWAIYETLIKNFLDSKIRVSAIRGCVFYFHLSSHHDSFPILASNTAPVSVDKFTNVYVPTSYNSFLFIIIKSGWQRQGRNMEMPYSVFNIVSFFFFFYRCARTHWFLFLFMK